MSQENSRFASTLNVNGTTYAYYPVSAVGGSPGAPSAVMVTWANCSMFSWWQMPAPGGTMRTFSNDSCDHFKKS